MPYRFRPPKITQVVGVPGHTDGSIALLLPEHGVLFTGDAVAAAPGTGEVVRGVFNVDGERATASLQRLAALDCEVVCFGHGDPVTEHARRHLVRAAGRYGGQAGRAVPRRAPGAA